MNLEFWKDDIQAQNTQNNVSVNSHRKDTMMWKTHNRGGINIEKWETINFYMRYSAIRCWTIITNEGLLIGGTYERWLNTSKDFCTQSFCRRDFYFKEKPVSLSLNPWCIFFSFSLLASYVVWIPSSYVGTLAIVCPESHAVSKKSSLLSHTCASVLFYKHKKIFGSHYFLDPEILKNMKQN